MGKVLIHEHSSYLVWNCIYRSLKGKQIYLPTSIWLRPECKWGCSFWVGYKLCLRRKSWSHRKSWSELKIYREQSVKCISTQQSEDIWELARTGRPLLVETTSSTTDCSGMGPQNWQQPCPCLGIMISRWTRKSPTYFWQRNGQALPVWPCFP